MARYEPDTGAWVYDGPEPGQCDGCGGVALIDEDGRCLRCAAGEPVLTPIHDALVIETDLAEWDNEMGWGTT